MTAEPPLTGRPLRRPPQRPDEGPERKRGLIISAAAHGVVVLVVLFGGPLFQADEAQAVRIADVDIISSSAFDAMVSSAPEGPRGEAASLVAPREGRDAPAPESSKADAPPERAETARNEAAPAPTQAPTPPKAPQAPAQSASDAPSPQAPNAPDAPVAPPRGMVASGPPLPAGPDRPDAPQRAEAAPVDAAAPRKVDRVAPTPAPPKDVIAEAPTPTPASKPSDKPTQTPAPQAPAAAPREAAAQIVTEADETSDQDTLAPTASAPPVGRPQAPEKTRAPETPPTQVAEAAPKPADKPAATPSQSAGSPSPQVSTNAPMGPKLTSGQVEGVKLGIQQYWREDMVTRLPNYEELKVTVSVKLDPSGKAAGPVRFVSPTKPSDSRWKTAMDVARRALERAAGKGFDLPRDSYGRWKEIEVTFNPAGGVSF